MFRAELPLTFSPSTRAQCEDVVDRLCGIAAEESDGDALRIQALVEHRPDTPRLGMYIKFTGDSIERIDAVARRVEQRIKNIAEITEVDITVDEFTPPSPLASSSRVSADNSLILSSS